jgi:hypothetical protein
MASSADPSVRRSSSSMRTRSRTTASSASAWRVASSRRMAPISHTGRKTDAARQTTVSV